MTMIDEPTPVAERWAHHFDCSPPRRPDAFLERAIAWRVQVDAAGDISAAVRADLKVAAREIRAERVGNRENAPQSSAACAEIVAAAPSPRRAHSRASCVKTPLAPASSQLTPGTRLVKHYGDRNHVVEVTGTGFSYDGATYASLSAVAKHITGTHWNGLLFFGLRKRGVYPKRQSSHG